MIDASISCSIVFPMLVPSENILSLLVELAHVFWYRSADFISGTFLPQKRSKGTLVERYDLYLMYLPFGSLVLFMKERKNKRKSYHLVSSSIHESKQKQKEKLPLGLGEPVIVDAQVLTFFLKVPLPQI
jgi:hypothetical protein